ncbi:hypothetical protein L596_022975 [Steinernema carpocapsae]|uniref:Uncharacterized protein n=1 Tax=Steinernema carpocapsae TaxID=34508 RepID=A0A4U5MC74_STECR|nr:hypothetical protein L596_022975 [Steinernema carpocapsae]
MFRNSAGRHVPEFLLSLLEFHSTRRKLTPKRTTHYRRPNKESLPVDASNLLVDEEDLFYGPQLLLDESLLTNGGDIPVFNADDIDNVLADLEFLNLHQ